MKKLFLFIFSIITVGILIYVISPPLDVEKYFSPTLKSQSNQDTIATYHIPNLFVSDMHGDTLLWHRDISERSTLGHADVHRLREANVGLQIFMSVIESPNDVSSDAIEEIGDQITPIAILDKWPSNTFTSYKKRALYQASKLYKAQAKSQGNLKVVLTREDLKETQKWQAQKSPLFAILGLEGAHATEFDIANLDVLYQAGYRTMELAHYTDTSFAGSSSGMIKYGLTESGIRLVQKMNEKGMIIDVAHLAPQAIEDVLKLSTKPVFSSHTGVYGTCKKARNISDKLIKRIALQGGVIGIGFFEDAICGDSIEALVAAIKYVRDLVGAEFVGLGSGWDIAPLAVTPKQLPDLSKALQKAGFSEMEIRQAMGGNVLRFFQENLPNQESTEV